MRRVLPVLLLLLAACSSDPVLGPGGEPTIEVVVESADARLVFRAEVADDADERHQGLRNRETLGPREAMLFVFDDVRARTFTMEDVLIPLDLLVIRAGRVVQVIQMVPCEPGAPCVYATDVADLALEIAGGVAAAARIEPGAVVAAQGL